MQFLQRCGCHELQGFLTGRPMTLEQLVQLSGVISRP
jgi:EAL domain-containing protein (putative c-di-GMP-specific phosphodiesterase class I)